MCATIKIFAQFALNSFWNRLALNEYKIIINTPIVRIIGHLYLNPTFSLNVMVEAFPYIIKGS